MKKREIAQILLSKLHGVNEMTPNAIRKIYPSYTSGIPASVLLRWLLNEKFALVTPAAPTEPPALDECKKTLEAALDSLMDIYGIFHDDVKVYDDPTVNDCGSVDSVIYYKDDMIASLGYDAKIESWYYQLPIFNDIRKTYIWTSTYKKTLQECIDECMDKLGFVPEKPTDDEYSLNVVKRVENAVKAKMALENYDMSEVKFTWYTNEYEIVTCVLYKKKLLGNIAYDASSKEWYFHVYYMKESINYHLFMEPSIDDMLKHHR